MSYPKLRELLLSQGHNIGAGTIHKYAKKLGFGRTKSEAKRNRDPNPLDYSISYMDERTIEAIDGFLLGDGCIQVDVRSPVNAGRATCTLEYLMFSNYLMDWLKLYQPKCNQSNSPKSPCGFCHEAKTKYHPDFYAQKQRWYPDGGKKQPPNDVRITPLSVMMWYLGDGSLVINETANTVVVRLSTDGFLPERVEFLVKRLNDIGITCHRNNDNRIMIGSRGVPAFFDFIGRKSPVACYDYKFDLPEWRLTSKRMKDVSDELGVSYNRLSHLVKIGKIPCHRASTLGKPRFLPEHIEYVKSHKKELGL